MWTQNELMSLNLDANQGSYSCDVNDPNNIIQVGNWIVISPLMNKCEIRKIDSFNGTTVKTVHFSIKLEFDHYVPTPPTPPTEGLVYLQTSPNWDILLFGADPTYAAADNTLAINNAINDCAVNGGGIVSIPKGEYFVEDDGTNNDCCINMLPSQNPAIIKNNVKFVGEGIDVSKIIIDPTQTSNYLSIFLFKSTSANGISDLTIDGGILLPPPITPVSNEKSLVTIIDCINLDFERVSYMNSEGFGKHLSSVSNINVSNCSFTNLYNNGVYFEGGDSKNNSISACFFGCFYSKSIFIQNSDGAEFNNLIISSNIFNKDQNSTDYCDILAESQTIATTFYLDIQISNNIFTNGYARFESCRNLFINNNIINIESGITVNDFLFTKQCKNILLSNNVISNKNDSVFNIVFSSFEYISPSGNLYLTIQGINVTGNTFQNAVCKFQNVKDVLYASNQDEIILTATPPAPFDNGFYFLLDQAPELFNPDWHDWGNVTIANNQLNGKKKTGISFYKNINIDSAKFNILCITGNLIAETENYGIIIDAINHQPYWNRALIATSNMINNIPYNYSNDLTTILVCGSYITEENPNQEIWISRGDPNGLIEAPQGSLAIDNSIEADNKYQKNTLDGSNGWTLVSELDKQLLFEEFFLFQTQVGATPPYHLAYQESIAPNLNILYAPPSPPGPPVPTPWMYPNGVYFSWDVTQYQRATIHNTGVHNIAVIVATADNTVTGNLPDCIVKAIFYNKDLTVTGEGVGLCLRYDDNNSNSRNYWVFYVKNTNTPGMMELHLEKVVNNVTTVISLPINTVAIGRSKMFKLKAVLQGNFVSVFYNDLLIVTVEDSINNTNHKHGIYGFGNPNHFYCEQFKILIS